MKISIIWLFTLSFFLNIALADGPRLEEGLYDGEVVIIRLTFEQKEFLSQHPEKALKLTEAQSNKIERIFSVKTTLLEVWDTMKYPQSDCACGSANIALRFSKDFLEVLKPYLVTDQEFLETEKRSDTIQ